MKSIKTAPVKKVAAAAKTKADAPVKTKAITSGSPDKKDVFNIHLVLPPETGLDAKNVQITVEGLQVVIELQSKGGLAANQAEGVKKIPTPPRPRKPVEDLFNKLKFRFTTSKEAIR